MTNTNYLSSTLNASLILVDSLALVVRDGAALLAVLRLALLLRHGDTLLLALGVSSPAVLARPGGGQGTLENINIQADIQADITGWLTANILKH